MDALKYIVTKALLQLGFTPGYNGFFFLRDAVIIARRDPEALTLITKLIYGTTCEGIWYNAGKYRKIDPKGSRSRMEKKRRQGKNSRRSEYRISLSRRKAGK